MKVGRYKKWQKLTQDMPFRPLFLLNLSRNQVFLLEIMYPNTSLLFDPNRSTQDEYIFPIINPQCIVQNVFCALHACHSSFVHVFIRGDTKTSTKYDFFFLLSSSRNSCFFSRLLCIQVSIIAYNHCRASLSNFYAIRPTSSYSALL